MNQNVQITLSNETTTSAGYWLWLEEIVTDDIATTEDVADFIDSLYGTSICDSEYDLPVCGGELTVKEPDDPDDATPLTGSEGNEGNEDPTTEEFTEAVQNVLQVKSCNQVEDYFQAQVKVVRSHITEPYKAVLSEGEILSTEIVDEVVTYQEEVQNRTSMELKYPVVDSIAFRFAGGVVNHDNPGTTPAITYQDGTLSWGDSVTGVVSVTVGTRYNVLTIQIDRASSGSTSGVGFSNSSLSFINSTITFTNSAVLSSQEETQNAAEALLSVFYRYEVTELTINEPELQEAIDINGDLCGGTSTGISNKFNDKPGYCYDLVTRLDLCRCSGEEKDKKWEEVEVECRDGAGSGRHLYNTYTDVDYVDCGEVEDVRSATFYKSVCCESPPDADELPYCRESTRQNPGGKTLSEEDRKYYTSYHEHVSFIPISPEDGDCGLIIKIQDVPTANCCIDPPPMSWDETHSELEWDETYIFSIVGGTEPFSWSVEGEGLSISGHGRQAKVTVSNCFCAPSTIGVEDDCGLTLEYQVVSEEGSWQIIDESQWPSGLVFKGDMLAIDYPGGQALVGGSTEYRVSQIWEDSVASSGLEYEQCYDDVVFEDEGTAYITPETGAVPDVEGVSWVQCPNSGKRVFLSMEDDNPHTVYYPSTSATLLKWKCSEEEDLMYDDENSAEVIGDNSYGYITWDGGRPPFKVNVDGIGFFIDSGHTETNIITNKNNLRVYVDDNGCGICNVTVKDDCDATANGTIRAVEGKWTDPVREVGCRITGFGESVYSGRQITSGGIRQTTSYQIGNASNSSTFENGHDCSLCGSLKTKDWYDDNMPYSREASPCCSNPPSTYPCYFWDYVGVTFRSACTVITNQYWEEWIC